MTLDYIPKNGLNNLKFCQSIWKFYSGCTSFWSKNTAILIKNPSLLFTCPNSLLCGRISWGLLSSSHFSNILIVSIYGPVSYNEKSYFFNSLNNIPLNNQYIIGGDCNVVSNPS